jgi:3-dehydroquinate synthase
MNRLNVDLGDRSYPIYIGDGLLRSNSLLSDLITSSQVMVITNTTVRDLYLDQLMSNFTEYNTLTHTIEDGEIYKTLETMNEIISELLKNKFSRDCTLIALGGGVVGDITGFAAACYQRGSSYIQIPTTLLAQVDSSVGGKTAVNHALGKNMIGAFYQPTAVITDVNVLQTLPDRELSAGLAEVIKYGFIRDRGFYDWLDVNIEKLVSRDQACLIYAIERSCETKADVVSKDEREGGLRAILNFGHTFGHAIETALGYKDWLHGEAIAVGMIMAAELSSKIGLIEETEVNKIKSLIERAKLPTSLPASMKGADLRDLMSVDKKARDGRLRLVLLKSIGEAYVTDDFSPETLMEMLEQFPANSELA